MEGFLPQSGEYVQVDYDRRRRHSAIGFRITAVVGEFTTPVVASPRTVPVR